MLQKHKNALRFARPKLIKNVSISEQLLSYLIAEDIITDELKQEIDVSDRNNMLELDVELQYDTTSNDVKVL